MNSLAPLIFEPVPLPWAELRASLPRAIGLPDPEDETGDDEVLFKRIDRVLSRRADAAQRQSASA